MAFPQWLCLIIFCHTVLADDWLMGGLNHHGTRNQEDDILNKHNIKDLGVKWFKRTGLYTFNQPVSKGGYVCFGEFAGGIFQCVNATTNLTIWSTPLIGPVAGAAVIDGDKLIVCTIAGFCYRKFLENGTTFWTRQMPNPVWSSPLVVGNQVIIATNPGEESGVNFAYMTTQCCSKRGSIHYLNIETGLDNITPVYQIPVASFINVTLPIPNVYQGLNSTTTFLYGPSGGAPWGDFAYSPELNLIYVCTGQAYSPNASGMIPSGVDACFCYDLSGNLIWSESVRELRGNDILDIWNSALWWDPKNPTDVDIGTGPMFYKLTGLERRGRTKYAIAVGDKRGIWYVFDAETGNCLNHQGYNSLPGVPYPSSNGGYNLQSAGGKFNGRWRSYGNLLSTYSSQICNNSGNTNAECVVFNYAGNFSAHIVAMNGLGTQELDRFTRNETHFLGGLVLLDEMLFVRDAFHKKLLVLDALDLNHILLELDLSAYLSGVDLGASMMIANGQVYLGTGIFGSLTTNGLLALGLP
ncbi:PQQ-binding beta-propeller repeat protein [uncultured virus]|nr:PQQ-binding beta-propeller repeat protein [uncultured virus]